MKQLTINWLALELAFETSAHEFEAELANYFDLENGNVVFIDGEVNYAVGSIIDELDELLEEDADWTDAAIRGTDTFQQLSEIEQSNVLAAIKIEYGDSSQFREVPTFNSDDSYEWMESFIETVSAESLQAKLSEAICQRRPFHRFRDVLAEDRRVERQWYEFQALRQHETIIEWLDFVGVEPANPKEMTYRPASLPDLRKIMFAEVRRFVRLARDIDGVKRIALIGSLATNKEFPNDIDLLVTVSDTCDVAPLAVLGRQLSGHLNSYRAGADVFLASEGGDYLGRTCPWRECRPGLRTSCDAMHCGQRPYLHDDFKAVRLKKALISQPPVSLWPHLAATGNETPRDVREQLVEQLAQDDPAT